MMKTPNPTPDTPSPAPRKRNRAERRYLAAVGRTLKKSLLQLLGALGRGEKVFATCDSHGERPWHGTVVCDDCNRLYQTLDPERPDFAPGVCHCGKPLLPSADEAHFTARICCADCYKNGLRNPQGELVADL